MTPETEIMEGWVARWHKGDCGGLPLHEFLGLTWDEYAAWAVCRMTDVEAVAMILSRKMMVEPEGETT